MSSLKLDPTGALCLSTDVEGRDRSIRLWDLNKGNLSTEIVMIKKVAASHWTYNYRVTNSRYFIGGLHSESENHSL